MFAEPLSAAAAALFGVCVWSGLGWWVAGRLGWSGTLRLAAAPSLGWALQSTIALACSLAFGFSNLTMALSVVLVLGASALLGAPVQRIAVSSPAMPRWVYLVAALIAVLPAVALLPKIHGDEVLLAAPIFDHSKIALIDQMIREGVPPANPVFGDTTTGGGVAYYYLWHFAAAQLGRLAGASGWEADIAMSWFTAFASLALMCGVSFHLSRRVLAPAFVLLASITGSLRAVLPLVTDQAHIDRVVEPATGLGGWLFQTTWSPHHVASATCAVLVALLVPQAAQLASSLSAAALGLILAASFQSSLWVGGIVGPLAAAIGFCATFWLAAREQRRRLLVMAIIAAVIAIGLSTPLLLEQMRAGAARGAGIPVRLAPQYVLGDAFPEPLRRVLDIPAYWAVLLVLEFPVALFAGIALLLTRISKRSDSSVERAEIRTFVILAATSLVCGWLLFSTTGDNNDLGWRAVLPGLLVLTGAAGAFFAEACARHSRAVLIALLVGLLLSLPGGFELAQGYVAGMPSASAKSFQETPSMWQAVRRHAPVDARVASNPGLFADMTPWPVNISWALLANRRSCFAGDELALAFAPLSPTRRAQVAAQFDLLFGGTAGTPESTRLLREYGCDVVLLTAQDGAWLHDPFAMNDNFELVESSANKWRIYVVKR